MKRKVFEKKRAYLLTKMLEYAKANTDTSDASIKKSYKNVWKQQMPNFNVYGSYKEAYNDLYRVLGPIVNA